MQILQAAQTDALALGHSSVGTEHILLALVQSDDITVRVLSDYGVTVELVHADILQLSGIGKTVLRDDVAFTEDASRLPELALREALAQGRDHVYIQHIFAGLLRQPHSTAVLILHRLDTNVSGLRRDVLDTLSND